MSKMIRVLIADDHTIVRTGVRMLLEAEPDMEVVAEALHGQQAIDLVEALQPDVVLMDISMPGMDGLTATRLITGNRPDTRILALTMHREDEYFFEMLEAGASGYIVKGADPAELLEAIRVVGQGQVFLYPSVAGKLVQAYLKQTQKAADTGPQLSSRESEVLHLLARGYSSKEIAERLVISQSTVHSHRSNLMSKLGLDSRRALVQYAREHGIY
ncbi:MAG: response regulator transcription factor [Anaerolineales bacterium]|nr:response regulator transcription factor [Anaerolineales bacterium]